MKVLVRLVCVGAFIAAAAPITAQQPAASGDRQLPKPNYELAATWSASKVGKVIFDTAVTPHWLEFSDRFWYAFESPAGRKWWIVDPVKKHGIERETRDEENQRLPFFMFMDEFLRAHEDWMHFSRLHPLTSRRLGRNRS